MDAVPHTKRARPNRVRSIIGARVRRSQTTNSASSTTPAVRVASTRPSVQPRSGASITPYTKLTSPAVDSTAPGRSARGGAGSRDSGTSSTTASSASSTTGTFTRNTEPHQMWRSR